MIGFEHSRITITARMNTTKSKIKAYLDAVSEDTTPKFVLPDGTGCYTDNCSIHGSEKTNGNTESRQALKPSTGAKSSNAASVNGIPISLPCSISDLQKRVKQGSSALQKIIDDFDDRGFGIDLAIRKIAKALHARPKDQRSRYRTFATEDGKIITLRLSDHSAHPASFNRHKSAGDENVSVVVQETGDTSLRGKTDNVVITQYTYNTNDFSNKCDVVKLIESVKTLFDTGKYNDLTGKAIVDRQNISSGDAEDAMLLGIDAYDEN